MILGIIPSRYESSRFQGKPLAEIKGKSMIQRVYENASKAKFLDKIIVATDDKRIFDHVKSFDGNVMMTASQHKTGTDRCNEVVEKLNEQIDYVINIQGDEPLINPAQIDELAIVLKNNDVEIATQITQVITHDILFNTGEVKVVMNKNKEALYFSRQVIPAINKQVEENWLQHFNYYRHVGMYAYRTDVLKKIASLKSSSLEEAESLEQLRWLENGFKIKCVETKFESHCVDTPEDLEKIGEMLG